METFSEDRRASTRATWTEGRPAHRHGGRVYLGARTVPAGAPRARETEGRSPKEEAMSEGKAEREPMVPGDKAQPGAENAGEDLCPVCQGTGRHKGGEC